MAIHAHFASRDLPAVGTKSRVLLALLPPSRARASPFPFRGGVSSGSRGGLCAMLEGPKVVPMARPYASYTPIFVYIHVRLASLTNYRPWKMNCKLLGHAGGLRTAEGHLQSNGNKVASLRSS